MKHFLQMKIRPFQRPSGFALVVTLSLMVLLTVVAVGLLGLSAVTLRSGSQGVAQAEARANARLALMLALGDLQKTMGPDQRVSANGAIVSESTVKHPHWTGVWDSWQAGPTASGTDLVSEHSTIPDAVNKGKGMAPTYQAERRDHFRSWLVSLDPEQAKEALSPSTLALSGDTRPGSGDNAVRLVGAGSLGLGDEKKTDYISAGLLNVNNKPSTTASSGRYGWWIGDESQKARIMDDSYNATPAQTLAERISRHQAPGSTGTTTVKGLEDLTDDTPLDAIPSLRSLDLVSGVKGQPAENFLHVTPHSHQVLADVREGGLKRDLSTLLERPIDTSETQDPFMLYRFDTDGQARVPIQDLAAYYQMYDSSRDADRTKGIRYTSSPQNNFLPNAIQVAAPDFGDGNSKSNTNKYLREYTSLYRSPVPIKIQFIAGMRAEPLATPTASGHTHRLVLGFMPAVTLWNPNNVPITMNMGDPNLQSQMLRLPNLSLAIEWNLSDGYVSKPVSLAYAASSFSNPDTGQAGASNKNEFIFDMYFSATTPVTFEPGEVRLFSYSGFNGNFSMDTSGNQRFIAAQEAKSGWDSSGGFLPGRNSAWRKSSERASDPRFVLNGGKGFLAFKASDTISLKIKTEKECNLPYALAYGTQGAAMNFGMAQKSYAVQLSGHTTKWGWQNYDLRFRRGSPTNNLDFNDRLIRKGYPTGPFTVSVTGAELISMLGRSQPIDQWKAFLQFALMAGCETNEATNGTYFAGRKFASRPFLHSSPIKPPYIDSDDHLSLYNYGWNWWVQDINSILEAYVENDPRSPRRGLYGGGFSLSNGTGHVVQQEIPVTPPLSIAAMSHAHLGGFSIATNDLGLPEDPAAPPSGYSPYERVTAVGYGGLFPHTLQAIGNSYAYPNIAADKAFISDWTRTFVAGSPKSVTLADHSYLANKALWDEFFFSSITPRPDEVKVFESSNRTAKDVAQDFFFKGIPLPNRRLVPYKNHLDDSKLDNLFAASETTKFNDGLADKIAAHLMIEGPFNVNSTSVEAWKVFLSSLKGKPIAYLDRNSALTGGVNLSEATASGTPVGPSSLPNGKPTSGSSNSPSDADQWSSWRELSDTEIEELATALVHQVKLRGPFLSLSEFVNRRLDSENKELSVKGALQAALDFSGDPKYPHIPAVSINAGFRTSAREFSKDEEASMSSSAFPEAVKGPVAYGSSAYVDQADVLRNFAEQLTPRGDTFVIRTYGDSLDASGKVQARAWCEAVVQRVPDYVDSTNEPYLKQSDPNLSNVNKTFGRQFQVVSFRWLGSSEV